MTASWVSLSAHRQATADLIRQEGRAIALSRPQAAAGDGVGGRVRLGVPTTQRPVQRFFSYTSPQPDAINMVQGEQSRNHWVLIGPYDDDIREGDTFVLDGVAHVVRDVHLDRSYQTLATGTVVSSNG